MLPHIAYANQQLIKGRATREAIEAQLQEVMVALRDQNNKVGEKEKDWEVAIKLVLGLLFGRKFKKILFESSWSGGDLEHIYIDPIKSIVRLAFPQYERGVLVAGKQLYIDSSIDVLPLNLPDSLHTLLLLMSGMATKTPNVGVLPSELDLLPKKGSVGNFIESGQRSYHRLCLGDSWLCSVFTGTESGVQNTQKHYASYPLRKAQAIFNQHCSEVFSVDALAPLPSPNFIKRIGSPYFLNKKVFSKILIALESLIQPLMLGHKIADMPVAILAIRFNALSWYMDAYGAFSCAIRNIENPLIKVKHISAEGLYRLNDKNILDGFNTRMTYVPAELQDLLHVYAKLKRHLLNHLTLKGNLNASSLRVVKNNDLFVFEIARADHIRLYPFKRTRSRDVLTDMLKKHHHQLGLSRKQLNEMLLIKLLKTNVHRHYLRGRLLDLEVPGYFIDAYFGHWHAGTQPWGGMSLFDKTAYLNLMKQHIPTILKELGFSGLDFKAVL